MEEQYSLWITPSGEVKDILQKIINKLSSSYNGPIFEPHMTLLGNIKTNKDQMIENARKLSSMLRQFSLSFSEVSFSTTYFQSVFIRVRSTSSLMNANMKAKEIYKDENTVFMPHISVLYGDHSMEEREKIAGSIAVPELTFIAGSLVVVPSAKDIATWTPIAEFKF